MLNVILAVSQYLLLDAEPDVLVTMLALWVVTLNQTSLSTQKTFRLQGEGILGALSFVFLWFNM